MCHELEIQKSETAGAIINSYIMICFKYGWLINSWTSGPWWSYKQVLCSVKNVPAPWCVAMLAAFYEANNWIWACIGYRKRTRNPQFLDVSPLVLDGSQAVCCDIPAFHAVLGAWICSCNAQVRELMKRSRPLASILSIFLLYALPYTLLASGWEIMGQSWHAELRLQVCCDFLSRIFTQLCCICMQGLLQVHMHNPSLSLSIYTYAHNYL